MSPRLRTISKKKKTTPRRSTPGVVTSFQVTELFLVRELFGSCPSERELQDAKAGQGGKKQKESNLQEGTPGVRLHNYLVRIILYIKILGCRLALRKTRRRMDVSG